MAYPTPRRPESDRKGQTALLDTTVFFVFMLLASTTVLVYSTAVTQRAALDSHENLHDYCEETTWTLLGATLPQVQCGADGSILDESNSSVRELLFTELIMLSQGYQQYLFREGLHAPIRELAGRLVRPGLEYCLVATIECVYGAEYDVWLSSDGDAEGLERLPDVDLASCGLEGPSCQGQYQVDFSLALWRA